MSGGGVRGIRENREESKGPGESPTSGKADAHGRPRSARRMTPSRIDAHGTTCAYHPTVRYGIGTKAFEALIAAQANKCLICDRPDPEHVDHARETGKVRGILCFNCNQGLGNFRDDVRVLVRAGNDLMRGSSWSGKGLEGIQVGTGRPAPA